MTPSTRSTSGRGSSTGGRRKKRAKRSADKTTKTTKTTKTKSRKSASGSKTAAAKRVPTKVASLVAVTPVNKFFELRQSEIQGRGGLATRPIRKGTRIIEYLGERISHDEADKRYDDTGMGRHHTFLFSIDTKIVIDAAVNGNEARFINHSCAPNCEAIDERKRIYIEAIRDIAAGEELTYDYAYERDGTEDEEWERLYMCKCGAATCRGTILAPPKPRGKK